MSDSSKDSISRYRAFELVDMRVGRVTRVEEHPLARKTAYKLCIDFGPELGVKTSSAQIVANYSKQDLMDRLVVCAVNLGVRNIAGFASEVLIFFFQAEDGIRDTSVTGVQTCALPI